VSGEGRGRGRAIRLEDGCSTTDEALRWEQDTNRTAGGVGSVEARRCLRSDTMEGPALEGRDGKKKLEVG